LTEHFHLPPLDQSFQEFQQLTKIVQSIVSDEVQSHLKKTNSAAGAFSLISNSRCCNKLRDFSWLLLMNRLNTRNLLKRKKSRLKERIALVPDHKPETRVLAQIACSSTRLGSDKFVTSQANIFARFVNELARAN
jgi:hypothetical protein